MDTTYKHHSLFIQANDAVRAAQEARDKAFRAADRHPSPENINRFLEADRAFQQAEKNRDLVQGSKKHMHNAVSDEVTA